MNSSSSLAVDGSTSADQGVCATTEVETDPWWLIDLDREVLVTSVRLQNTDYNRKWLLCYWILDIFYISKSTFQPCITG